MMTTSLVNNPDYAPYFRDGMLYLPDKTVNLLIGAGLDPFIARAALRGLTLDDDKTMIAEISDTLVKVLGEITEDSRAYQELNSQETFFMLSGRRG